MARSTQRPSAKRKQGQGSEFLAAVPGNHTISEESSPEALVPDTSGRGLHSESSTTAVDDREARVSRRAYALAQARGFAPGAEWEDWLQAEREIDAASVGQLPQDQFTG